MQGAITSQIFFALSCNGFGMIQSTHLVPDANKLFCDFVSSLICLMYHIVIVCQYFNKFDFITHFSSGRKEFTSKKSHKLF